jgi:hypothetical protein
MRMRSKVVLLFVLLLTLLGFWFVSTNQVDASTAQEIYLPVVMSAERAHLNTVVGAEGFDKELSDGVRARYEELRPGWWRQNLFSFATHMPNKGVIDPANESDMPVTLSLNDVDVALNDLLGGDGAAYTRIIATLKHSPEWARKSGSNVCSPLLPASFEYLRMYVFYIIEHYGHDLQVLEFGNEVDSYLPPGHEHAPYYGCWGDPTDTYYGGDYYGEALGHFADAVWDANAEFGTNVTPATGGFALPCSATQVQLQTVRASGVDTFEAFYSPNALRPDTITGSNPDQCNFVSGMIQGLREYGLKKREVADIALSFHIYVSHPDEWMAYSYPTLKRDFLAAVYESHGIDLDDVVVYMSEGGYICGEATCEDDPNFEGDKARYSVTLPIQALAEDYEMFIWFPLRWAGWHDAGLVRNDGTALPAFISATHLNSVFHEIQREQFAQGPFAYDIVPVGAPDLLRAFALSEGSRTWEIWWMDSHNGSYELQLSSEDQAFDLYGSQIEHAGSVEIGFDPIFILRAE